MNKRYLLGHWPRGLRHLVRSRRRGVRRRREERAASGAARTGRERLGHVTFDGIWTGSEATDFGNVIKAFNQSLPERHINYKPLGNNETTVLATAITGGNPPDMADIAAPGTSSSLSRRASSSRSPTPRRRSRRTSPPPGSSWGRSAASCYALVFKASNKSLLWYNVPAFKSAGVTPPTTFAQLLKDAQTLKASGIPAYSIGGSDGWTLTDLFENIYLRTFGPRSTTC